MVSLSIATEPVDEDSVPRPSLYLACRIISLVQRFSHRLGQRVHKRTKNPFVGAGRKSLRLRATSDIERYIALFFSLSLRISNCFLDLHSWDGSADRCCVPPCRITTTVRRRGNGQPQSAVENGRQIDMYVPIFSSVHVNKYLYWVLTDT